MKTKTKVTTCLDDEAPIKKLPTKRRKMEQAKIQSQNPRKTPWFNNLSIGKRNIDPAHQVLTSVLSSRRIARKLPNFHYPRHMGREDKWLVSRNVHSRHTLFPRKDIQTRKEWTYETRFWWKEIKQTWERETPGSHWLLIAFDQLASMRYHKQTGFLVVIWFEIGLLVSQFHRMIFHFSATFSKLHPESA